MEKMKSILYTLLVFGIVSIASFGCKKKSSTSSITYGSMSDIDGNSYKTITIGTKTWMAENLRVTKYNDGTAIANVTKASAWNSVAASTGVYCTYNNTTNADSIITNGRLYNFKAELSGKLCPTGWHVSTIDDWGDLTNNLIANGYSYNGSTSGPFSYDIGKSMANTTGWDSDPTVSDIGNNPSTNNTSGFSAIPSGSIDDFNNTSSNSFSFNNMGKNGYWWSPNGKVNDAGNYRELSYNKPDWSMSASYSFPNEGSAGLSVRCVKN